jgi:transposase
MIHDSNETKEWLKTKNINTLNWPAISPDLNPIENVWGILTRKLFANGKQFRTVKELKDSLIEWDNISTRELKKLIDSMPKRCLEIVKSRGATIKY